MAKKDIQQIINEAFGKGELKGQALNPSLVELRKSNKRTSGTVKYATDDETVDRLMKNGENSYVGVVIYIEREVWDEITGDK